MAITAASPRRGGNFDAIRLAAATIVIFGHSFVVAVEPSGLDFISDKLGALGVAAVETFFILSGYLVTMSYERSPSWQRFALARALRIFPGLIACVVVSVFVIGPAFTTLPLREYFAVPDTYLYLLNNSLLDPLTSPFLPSVAFHPFTGGNLINGSLWSLPFEFAFYAIVLLLGLLGRLNGRNAAVLLGLTLLSLSFLILEKYAWFLSYSAGGMAMYFLRRRGRFSGLLACVLGTAVVIGNYAQLPWPLFPVLGAYTIIYIAVDAPFEIGNATRFGDLSYGIYLYGWPCEEIAVHCLGGKPAWWQICALALPSAAALAWLSWHLVEQPMLRCKEADRSGIRQRIGVAGTLAYAAGSIVHGIGDLFPIVCLLPTALALVGGEVLGWVQLRLWNLRPALWGGVPSAVGSRRRGDD